MRKHYLDNIRWITILLVVLYHVIYMYNGITAGGAGTVTDFRGQDIIQYILYPWFMVILFIVSGMCSRYYLENHTDKEYIKGRTLKLLVPSTIGLLVLGWAQGYFNMAIAYAWFACLAILGAMKRWGNRTGKVAAFMNRRSFGLYIFHYLALSVAAYLMAICGNMRGIIVYLISVVAAYGGGFLLNEIVSRIPVIRWCVLGVRKEKKGV